MIERVVYRRILLSLVRPALTPASDLAYVSVRFAAAGPGVDTRRLGAQALLGYVGKLWQRLGD